MLTVSVQFLHGTIRASSPDNLSWADREPQGEWPPSPARLFSALVAGDGTRDRCRLTTGEDLFWLEELEPPEIYASPLNEVESSPLVQRYVVIDRTSETGAVQNYPARSAIAHRPGVRLSPRSSTVHYVWPAAQPTPEVLASLEIRAARVGYLGCADSPVRVTVGQEDIPTDAKPWVPLSGGSVSLPVPYPGFVENLDESFDLWTAGNAAERSWVRTVRRDYQSPADHLPLAHEPPLAIWLRLEPGVAGKRLVALTSSLRAAVTDHVQRLLPGDAEVPSVIHGHRRPEDTKDQACFIALPNVGHRHADGRLLGAAVLLPGSADRSLVQLVRTALLGLRRERLVKPGWFDLKVSLHGGERNPYTAHPSRWSSPARRWGSVSPVVFERWTKGIPDLAEVAIWCQHAGLPKPVAAGFQRTPLVKGGLDLHPADVARPGRERRPYAHLWVEFAGPIRGPVVLGRGRYLGLGLMAPVSEARGDADA